MIAAGIKPNPIKLFLAMCLVVGGNILMFIVLLAIHALLLKDIRQQVSSGETVGILFAINAVAYQNFVMINMITIYLIYLRFSEIIDFLKTIEKNLEETETQEILKSLKTCAELIDKVCDVLESIKLCYVINTVTYILHFSFFTVFTIYAIISYLVRKTSTEYDWIYTLLTLTWDVYYSPFVIWVVLMSNWIKNAGRRIERRCQMILHKSRHDVKIYKTTELILMQLEHRRPLISCGVFVIDWYFLFYMMELCLSYLVIIVQFEWKTYSE